METRNYLANAAGSPPPKPSSPSNGYPQSATPGVNEATTPGPFWFYKVGEELRKVITDKGLIPSDDDLGQLLEALNLRGVELSPAGSVMGFAADAAPTGWLKANGAAVSRTSYAGLFSAIGTTFGAGDGSTTFNLPDLRGEFVRGWDDGRGVDSGRALGNWQADEYKSHNHATMGDPTDALPGTAYVATSTNGGSTGQPTELSGGSETRPRNIALLYCIKY